MTPKFPFFNLHYLMLLLVCFGFSKVLAQKKMEVYQVEFSVFISDDFIKDLLDKDSAVIVKAYVNKEKIRVEESEHQHSVQISDLKDSISYRYFTDKDSTKTARRVPLADFRAYFREDPDDVKMKTDEKIKMTLSEQTEAIAGYSCHLARFSLNSTSELLVWYVKGLPQLFWGEHEYLKRVPGLPLKIIGTKKGSGTAFGIIASSVQKVKVDPCLFEVPADYKIQSH